MSEQDIEAARHAEKERREPAGSTQVELVHNRVPISCGSKLPHAEPLDVQDDHSAFGHIDAADLLVFGRLAVAVVTIDGQAHRDLPVELFRLLEQGGDPEIGKNLVADFLDLVALSRNRVEPLNLRL